MGDSDNAVPYQKVTLNEHMQWKDFPIENFIGVARSSAVRRETLDSRVGPVALIWNTDEPLPLNVDVSMSTDVFIFDATGKEV